MKAISLLDFEAAGTVGQINCWAKKYLINFQLEKPVTKMYLLNKS